MSGYQRTLIAGNADKLASNFANQVAASYQAAIIAAGGSISATHLTAVKAFVKTGYKDRWWFAIVDCCLFLGADLTSALVKIVAAPGAGTSYVNHNCVSGDYGATTGVSVSGNSTKYLSTGVIPADQGLGKTNISMLFGSTGVPNAASVWGCDETDPGNTSCVSGNPLSSQGNRGQSMDWSQSYTMGNSYMPTQVIGAQDGIRTFDQSGGNASDGTFVTEIEMFRVTKFAVRYIANTANAGFFAIGRMMTERQLRSMSAAAIRLHWAARTGTPATRYVYMGDSITHGQGVTDPNNTYPFLVNAARSVTSTTNTGIPGTDMGLDGNGLAGQHRYRGTETLPITKFFCMLGSNDVGNEDHTTDGDPVAIANYRSYLVTMANVLKGQGAQVIILSIPWTTRVNQTKCLAWVDGALGAASDAGVIGIDTCRPMIDSGDPGQYLGDTVHLNIAGHAKVADLILAVI